MPAANPNRLEVIDTLRSACPGASDNVILGMINNTEYSRQQGRTVAEEKAAVALSCQLNENCMTCGYAVVDQVYGQ